MPQNFTSPPVVTSTVVTTVLPDKSPELAVPVAVIVTADGVPPAQVNAKLVVAAGHWPVGWAADHDVSPVLPDSVQAI